MDFFRQTMSLSNLLTNARNSHRTAEQLLPEGELPPLNDNRTGFCYGLQPLSYGCCCCCCCRCSTSYEGGDGKKQNSRKLAPIYPFLSPESWKSLGGMRIVPVTFCPSTVSVVSSRVYLSCDAESLRVQSKCDNQLNSTQLNSDQIESCCVFATQEVC